MGSGKRFGSWDVIALHILRGTSRITIRRPARLAIRRTPLERLNAAIGPLDSWDEILTKPLASLLLLALFGGGWLALEVFLAPLAVTAIGIAIVGTLLTIVFGTSLVRDARLVMFRRRRVGICDATDADAAAELRERRERWDANLMKHEHVLSRQFIPGTWRLWVALLPLVPASSLIPSMLGVRSLWPGFLVVATMFGTFVVTNRVTSDRLNRVKASLTKPICPDCGYSLNRGKEVADHDGNPVHFGPPRCPECGTPWPLIPAPVRRVSQ